MRAKAMPAGQVAPQFEIVVNLAVKSDPERAILVRQRLMASLQVDDRQTPVAEPDGPIEKEPFVVRATMRNGSGHRHDRVAIDGLAGVALGYTDDSAHGLILRSGYRRSDFSVCRSRAYRRYLPLVGARRKHSGQ